MDDKLIITCAVTGAETTRAMQPALPITPEEIAQSAFEAYEAGASILHMHVRQDDGTPTQDRAIFQRAIDLVRAKCDMVIEVTTGGAVGMSAEERLQPVALNPEMASLDCGTVNFGDDYIVNTLPDMRRFAREMKAHGVRPTLECFDLGHVYASHILIREGLLEPPYHYGLVLNVPGAAKYEPEVLAFLVRRLPEGAHWTAMGIGGKANLDCLYATIALGGHVRVGFEDNIFYSKGRLATSNAELVARAARIAADCGRELARPDDVRRMLALRGA
nr:3-keto-5-aminohexanoate cleavage protein [uncultured Holophaga sp.]